MKRKLLALLLTVAIVYCFSGCFVQELYENYKTEAVTMIVTEETIAELEDFPNLLTADLSGSTCYDAMEAYKTAHPDVEVTYTIQVLDAFYSMDTAALDLSAMTAADLPQILDALPRLPKVTEVNLMKADGTVLGENYHDCGCMIFDPDRQDVHSGGSGCGCVASVLCGYVLPQMRQGRWKRALVMGTGALMSPTSMMQGESVPGIAHLIELEVTV